MASPNFSTCGWSTIELCVPAISWAVNRPEISGFQPDTVRGGHAICIVGYREDGRFIVRNSWGTGWGDKGFGYLDPAYITDAFFDESYGVTI